VTCKSSRSRWYRELSSDPETLEVAAKTRALPSGDQAGRPSALFQRIVRQALNTLFHGAKYVQLRLTISVGHEGNMAIVSRIQRSDLCRG